MYCSMGACLDEPGPGFEPCGWSRRPERSRIVAMFDLVPAQAVEQAGDFRMAVLASQAVDLLLVVAIDEYLDGLDRGERRVRAQHGCDGTCQPAEDLPDRDEDRAVAGFEQRVDFVEMRLLDVFLLMKLPLFHIGKWL